MLTYLKEEMNKMREWSLPTTASGWLQPFGYGYETMVIPLNHSSVGYRLNGYQVSDLQKFRR